MKFENTRVYGFQGAVRGMRNPKNSWARSDSKFFICNMEDDSTWGDSLGEVLDSWVKSVDGTVADYDLKYDWLMDNGMRRDEHSYDPFAECVFIGPNDMKLMQQLIRSGSEHRKFMRQIMVSVDITAPQYWWSEFDTYKVGTVANSTSKMHKLATTPITEDCFESDDMVEFGHEAIDGVLEFLEYLRTRYLETKNKEYWKELIRWLPESWLQKRTVTMSYENLLAMCSPGQRRFHKLNEWSGKDKTDVPNFIAWARTLPYAQELIFLDELDKEKE